MGGGFVGDGGDNGGGQGWGGEGGGGDGGGGFGGGGNGGGGDGDGGNGGDDGGGGATPEHMALFSLLHLRVAHLPLSTVRSTCTQSSVYLLVFGWPEAQLVYMSDVSGMS